jgi:DNA-binding transcriptional LysR family regulator
MTVLDSVDRLRQAADPQHRSGRMVRIGTVNAATTGVLTPAIREFRDTHPSTQVEVVGAQQTDIQRAILEGSLDLGLINYLDGDDRPPEFQSTELLRGRAVVCMRPDDALAAGRTVRVSELLTQPLIMMRSGYVMHRYTHRLLDGHEISVSYSTDGAELGKLMVAQGLGITLLPDFSVVGDPLEQGGIITWRPLEDDHTEVQLVLQRRRSGSPSRVGHELHQIFVRRAGRADA